MSQGTSPYQRLIGRSPTLDAIDFFPTPPEPVHSILDEMGHILSETLWEPACGNGIIAEILSGRGFKTLATDLRYYGYVNQHDQLNFLGLRAKEYSGQFDIITNPPYSQHIQFIQRGLELAKRFLVYLLPLTYLTPSNKREFYTRECKVMFFPLGYRPAFIMPGYEKASKMKDYMWVVWDKSKPPDYYHTMKILEMP